MPADQDVNDREEDALELATLLSGFPNSLINLMYKQPPSRSQCALLFRPALTHGFVGFTVLSIPGQARSTSAQRTSRSSPSTRPSPSATASSPPFDGPVRRPTPSLCRICFPQRRAD